jgi:hypothetical protein
MAPALRPLEEAAFRLAVRTRSLLMALKVRVEKAYFKGEIGASRPA